MRTGSRGRPPRPPPPRSGRPGRRVPGRNPGGSAGPGAAPGPGRAGPGSRGPCCRAAGGLLVAQAVDAAEHDREPERLGEPVDLLDERPAQLGPVLVDGRGLDGLGRPPGRSRACRRDRSSRARLATRRATPNSQGASRSRSRIEPARRTRTRNVAWKASSTSSGSRQQPPADAQDHRAVPGDQGGERRLVPAGRRTARGAGPRPGPRRSPPRTTARSADRRAARTGLHRRTLATSSSHP